MMNRVEMNEDMMAQVVGGMAGYTSDYSVKKENKKKEEKSVGVEASETDRLVWLWHNLNFLDF